MALSYYPVIVNKYKKRSKILEAQFRQIVKLYALDIEAAKIAELTGLSPKTINKVLYQIRVRIAEYCQQQSHINGIENF